MKPPNRLPIPLTLTLKQRQIALESIAQMRDAQDKVVQSEIEVFVKIGVERPPTLAVIRKIRREHLVERVQLLEISR
ncbi:MAG: hypothetical protein HZA37_01090 [Parcubacteria group bacterium]|nr:hypothetical protein [Parcubacteria group bacterium]